MQVSALILILSFIKWSIILCCRNTHISRTDNLTAIYDFLKSMCAPTCNSGCSEHRCIKLTRNVKHTVKQTAVKIDIGRNTFINLTLFADNLRSKSFYSLIKFKVLIIAFCFCKFLNCALKNNLTRVRNCINSVTHTIDKTHSVECLLFEYFSR